MLLKKLSVFYVLAIVMFFLLHQVNGLAQTMRDNTDSTQLPLPVNDTDLDHRYYL